MNWVLRRGFVVGKLREAVSSFTASAAYVMAGKD